MDIYNYPLGYGGFLETNTSSAMKAIEKIEGRVKIDVLKFWRDVNKYKAAKLRGKVIEIKKAFNELDNACLAAIDSLSSIHEDLITRLGFSHRNEDIQRIESFFEILTRCRENRSSYDIFLDKEYYKKGWLFTKDALLPALDNILGILLDNVKRSTGGTN